MKKGFITILAAAAIAISAISCSKADDVLSYNNMTMGNVEAGVFTSDQGNIFNVTEQTCTGQLEAMERAFVICDVLKKTEGTENEYDVRVNFIAEVLEKRAIPVSEISDLETYMNDPLIVSNAWTAGGYVNFLLTVPVVQDSKEVHEINLLHDYQDGAYIFNIRHDAKGEIIKKDDDRTFVLSTAYVSFPIKSIITEDKAKITLNWNSYVTDGSTILYETKESSGTKDYVKSEFEH